ncbi:MAG: HU family DNA-binding protein [Flavobacteriales bacterium]
MGWGGDICFFLLSAFVSKQITLFLHPSNHEEQEHQKQQTYFSTMTKADIVSRISDATGMEKHDVQNTVEAFMTTVRESLEQGENVYLRGFGSFVIKTRAAKTGRNILAKTSIEIPAHNIPSFKPAKDFVDNVKQNVKVED